MKISIEEMKNAIRADFAENNPGMLIGFLKVENTVEVAGWSNEYLKEGVILVAYKGYDGEVQYEILTEMHNNLIEFSRPDES